ncbi:MAG: V-type ATPase subunit [Candidatus Nezhaarchaeota archaeon]|nr:V-type ATPase subunit [Candidatus Nezhaarchaeota archaeon]MCX8141843.1 V-type ATPase subunit [Candidatus Nezhaarchaeota archaeon]MDW8050376.1 V-type ATPase subunit [Nitrososphaerota archaeon]
MNTSSYAYSTARIRAKRAFILRLEDYEVLLRAPTIQQVVAHLRSVSDIAREIPPTTDPQEIERYLLSHFIETLHSIAKMVGGDARTFLETAFSKFEYETLKAILKAKFLGLPENEIPAMAPPVGEYSGSLYASLVSARGTEQAIDMIPNPELRILVKEAVRQAENIKSPIPIDVIIDKWLYTRLWKLRRRLQGYDYKWTTHLTGIEIDITNIMVAIRCKELSLQPTALDKLWIPITYRLTVDIKSLISQPFAAMLQTLSSTYYGRAISPLAKSAKEVEKTLKTLWLRENEAVFLHYPFTVGVIYAYANIKYLELKDIRAILLSKIGGMPVERVIPMIIRFSEKLSI